MALWVCPACGRKVPGYSTHCHCGVSREAAAQAPPRTAVPALGMGPVRFQWADVPRAAWVAVAVIVLALLLGLWRLFQPAEPNPIPPLLGHWERGVPTPKPGAAPKAALPPRQRPSGTHTPMPLRDDMK